MIAAANPALPISGQSTAWHDTMQVRMVHEILPPGVQDGVKSDLRSQMLRVGRNGLQSLGRGSKQCVIHHRLILVRDGGNLFRECENNESLGVLDQVGGLSYLGSLARDTPTAANIRTYAEIVRERSLLRQLITAGNLIVGNALEPEGREAREIIDDAERAVFEIAELGSRGKSGFQWIKNLLGSVSERIQELSQSDGGMSGMSSGFKAIDEQTAGLQAGDLIIIAGRPSMGKTTLAVNIAENAALAGQKSVAIFSMEMSAESLTLRMISSIGRVNQSSLRSGRLQEDDWPRIDSAMTQLAGARLFVDATPALTPTEVRARARRLKRERGGLDLIVVDYLQLMRGSNNKENRATEISEISRSLKALAKELHVPVIALSQLNRAVEQRVDKRPVMSDLRESGGLEQDADVILLIYREDQYDQSTTRKGIADIIIAKQRVLPVSVHD
jgi:replicative DNA helicase